jgi:hypothetical protein
VVASSVYDLVGFGGAAVIQPSLPKDILLNPDLLGDIATALPHVVRGQRVTRWIRVKAASDSVLLLKYEQVRQWAEKRWAHEYFVRAVYRQYETH